METGTAFMKLQPLLVHFSLVYLSFHLDTGFGVKCTKGHENLTSLSK